MDMDFSSDIVPPLSRPRNRTLILCFDGTGRKISAAHSNVAQFFSLLTKYQPSDQLVYYQTGIGTYTPSTVTNPVFSKISKTVDLMFAGGIASHVRDGYAFIMQHYLNGDKICIFGFSRGAYTARALAGMIHKVGLLPRGNIRHLKHAYKIFMQTSQEGWKNAADFKRCFCIEVAIEFVGIWDSVGSVGLNRPGLPFSNASTTIKTFRHALALDERRAFFKANAWHCVENVLSSDPQAQSVREYLQWERDYLGADCSFRTDVLEVWFAGCHSDIGGGAVPNDTSPSLARIPLRWMVRECFRAKTGILFSRMALSKIGMDPERLYPLVVQRIYSINRRWVSTPQPLVGDLEKAPTPEEQADALSPMHDELNITRWWWILELLPFQRWIQQADSDGENQVAKSFSWNLGHPRLIIHPKFRGSFSVHYTVKTRMSNDQDYSPKVEGWVEPIWVE